MAKGYNGGLFGEVGLLVAVLIRARLDLEAPQKAIRRDAVRFFTYYGEEAWSYEWICNILNKDADKLRILLIKQKLIF